jgi:hypothetical protein
VKENINAGIAFNMTDFPHNGHPKIEAGGL